MQSCLKHLEQCLPPLLLFLNLRFLDSVTPVSASISVSVIASVSALASSSGSSVYSVPLCSGSITNEPLSGGQSDRVLFQKFKLFLDRDKSSNPPSSTLPSLSSALSVTVPSSRPVFFSSPFCPLVGVGVFHPGQPDFLAPLRVVAQYRATTEAGPGRLSLGAFSTREMLRWFLVIRPWRTII